MTPSPPKARVSGGAAETPRFSHSHAGLLPIAAIAAIALAALSLAANDASAEALTREPEPVLLPQRAPAPSLTNPLRSLEPLVSRPIPESFPQFPDRSYRLSRSQGEHATGDFSMVALGGTSAMASGAPFAIGGFRIDLPGTQFGTLEARGPLEYEGLQPILTVEELQLGSPVIAPSLVTLPSGGGSWTLRAGGDIAEVASFPDGDLVTFRLLDLDLRFEFEFAFDDAAERAREAGETDSSPSGFPARVFARGEVRESLRTYRVDRDLACPGPFDPPGLIIGDGMSISIPSGSTLLSEIEAADIVLRAAPLVSSVEHAPQLQRTLGPVPGAAPGSALAELPAHDTAATEQLIAELGLSGDDFEIEFDAASGVATITSSGDIVLLGGEVTLDSFRELVIRTPASIAIVGNLILPSDSSLSLDAFGGVATDPEVAVLIPPRTTARCEGLAFVEASAPETLAEIGFEALPVERIAIDVRPGRASRRVNPFSRGLLPVAILGSADFDVRDLDAAALRLGPSGAAPAHGRLGRAFDINDDGYRDVIVRFPTGNTGVAVNDEVLCLSGWTPTAAVEGCDAIDTQRRPRRNPLPGRRPRWVF